MDRNIASVAMIYTNYDPKPQTPGGNIRPVIQATIYIKLHRPQHKISGHFPHHTFKTKKIVSPDYDFHPTPNHYLPMNKEKDVNARCFFIFFSWNFFMFLFFWLRRNTKQKNRTEDTRAAGMQISIPRPDIVSLRFRETVMLR